LTGRAANHIICAGYFALIPARTQVGAREHHLPETRTMQVSLTHTRWSFALATLTLALVAPVAVQAQSGKWVATISQLGSAGGAADITVESRNEKQSRVKITFRNTRRDMRLAWDVVSGNCREEGAPIAPAAAFNQVQTQMDGGGTASANVPKLQSGKSYYVRVYDPQTAPTDASAFGCGNLSEKN
jgi:hypothetical protein